jgi:proline iminopeptidase
MTRASTAVGLILFNLFAPLSATQTTAAQTSSRQARETIFDRVIHLEEELILEIPHTPRLEEVLGIEGRKVSVGDAELWVEEEGRGTPIVLLNGGPGGTHHMFHPWFGRAADFARVIYYDQRGTGLSDYEPGPDGYSVEQAVEDLEALRKALAIDKLVLVGTSYGGFLAQFYTTTYPENVAGLVLVGASANVRASTGRSRQQEFISDQERAKMRESSRELRALIPEKGWTPAEFLALIVYNNHINGDWKRQNYYKPTSEEFAYGALYEWVHDGPFNGVMSQSASRVDLTGAFDVNPIPTLIMEGEWDLTWGAEKKHALAANHPNGRMVVFDEAAHSIFNEDPDGFFDTLQAFVEGLQPVSSSDLAVFQAELGKWREAWMASPAYHLRAVDWGRSASERIAESFAPGWLDESFNSTSFLRLGFALYDVAQYDDALKVFRRFKAWAIEQERDDYWALASIWCGHMLDLLYRRSEAIGEYRAVADLNLDDNWSHGQYGMQYSLSPYASERVNTPFLRIENRER